MIKRLAQYWLAISLITLASGALWIWYSSARLPVPAKGEGALPHPGFKAPDFELASLSGEGMRLSDLHGKPVIINLWTSWCPPCQAEMPSLEKIYRDYSAQGLVVLGINATEQDAVDKVRSFVEARGITFPILLDEQGTVSRAYQLSALPTTYFVDSHGTIQEIIVGGPVSEARLKKNAEDLLRIK